jgi:hypothetical protein
MFNKQVYIDTLLTPGISLRILFRKRYYNAKKGRDPGARTRRLREGAGR